MIRDNNRRRIQGALHLLCLAIKGFTEYMDITLPFPLILEPKGFIIMQGRFEAYELNLVKEPVVTQSLVFYSQTTRQDEKHVEFREKALLLLDANIRHINYLAGEK